MPVLTGYPVASQGYTIPLHWDEGYNVTSRQGTRIHSAWLRHNLAKVQLAARIKLQRRSKPAQTLSLRDQGTSMSGRIRVIAERLMSRGYEPRVARLMENVKAKVAAQPGVLSVETFIQVDDSHKYVVFSEVRPADPGALPVVVAYTVALTDCMSPRSGSRARRTTAGSRAPSSTSARTRSTSCWTFLASTRGSS